VVCSAWRAPSSFSTRHHFQETILAISQDTAREQAAAQHTRWNFTVLGADIAFFSLGLSISSAYTLLPLLVHHLTTDNVAVSLIPALRALGLYAPPLLIAAHVERRRYAMPFILRVTLLERIPYLVLALGTVLLAQRDTRILLILLYSMIFLALLGSGLTGPAWLDMIARAIPQNGSGGFLDCGQASEESLALLAQPSRPRYSADFPSRSTLRCVSC